MPFYNVRAPSLPLPTSDYDQRQQDQFQSALRLYFNRLDESLTNLANVDGGRLLNFPRGAFYDTVSQYDGSNTIPYAVQFNATQLSSGVSITNRTVVATGSIGPASTTMTITAITSGRFYPGQTLSGTGVTSGTYVYLQLSSTATAVATPTATGTIGTPTLTVSDATGIEVRQFVSGTGVPANTRVINVVGTTVTLSANLTSGASGTYTFRPWGYQGTYSVSPSQTVSSTTITGTLPSMITFEYSGIYNIQFSLQFANTGASEYDVDVWFKQNDVDIIDSNSQFTVPKKHGSTNGHLIAALNFFVEVVAGDVVELVWHTENSDVFIEAIPAQTNPTRPITPSAIATVTFVSTLDQ